MRDRIVVAALVTAVSVVSIAAQTRRPAARPTAPAPTKAAAQIACPTPLGVGRTTKLTFCDVIAGRDPAAGIIVTIPPHRGDVTLTFDLHNRHTYSEEETRDPMKAFVRYTASIGALTMDNTLIRRAVVQSEFRSPADFFDRITGGAGPGGLKAVGPTGCETIVMQIPESENAVSILGEKLTIERAGVAPVTSPSLGRSIAIISNVNVEYRPPLAARTPARRPAARTPG
jgi:hypothetical protein